MLSALPAALAVPAAPALAQSAPAPPGFGAGFDAFLAGVRRDARSAGIRDATLSAAFSGLQPSARVLELDRHQPEFTLTWAQYRTRVITDQKVARGRQAFAQARPLMMQAGQRFGVNPAVIAGIWGMETAFGGITGGFSVVQALATLAWEGRRAAFFRGQLMDALRILDHGDISTAAMTGSYAGAMGQPQFMPDSYLRYAVDMDGDGRRDIWNSPADVYGSIANYLGHFGWQVNQPSSQAIRLPAGFDANSAGRANMRPLGQWMQAGVRRADGAPFGRGDVLGAVVIPDGPTGDAFMAYANFNVIRRYNPSDYYALGVGILGNLVTA